ncbi:MAG: ribonuclease G [Gammaproteobacteria bacterium]
MSEEILINITPRETRVATVENGVLQEVCIERTGRRGLVGNIYKGRVSRVLPGMQAAFVEVGLERAAFLHASDISASPMPGEEKPAENKKTDLITDLLREGQEVLVQVVKDPLGSKGARLTTHISIPSRYLVLMPGIRTVGVSQRIENEQERQRLKEVAASFLSGMDAGFIVRTAAEGATEEALRADMEFLCRLWESIRERIPSLSAGAVVHEDLPLGLRILRDLVASAVEKVRIDSRETHRRAVEFAENFIPDLVPRIEYYPGERPIFDLYSVEDEIQKALESKVQLKSGGYLVIDQTEAMTTIDVNTGSFVGHRNLEETIFKTNLEAAQSIARQLRLRNLGGIIIIDFIDMTEEDHKRQVLRALEKSLERDHAKCYISGVSALGLVEMTRKRTRESLAHVMCAPCATCSGRGILKTPETVCYEIFREILRAVRQFDAKQLLVLAPQVVVDMLLEEESATVAELEAFIGKPIKFQVETLYAQEQFDVVPM